MNEIDLLSKFCDKRDIFTNNEKISERKSETTDGEYLCVRLDGIGLSKKYLKNKISDEKFNEVMINALYSTYDVLHRKAPTSAQNIFLAMFICSDEVSIILNCKDNYYKRRLYKIVTTISSTFSSFFTSKGYNHNQKNSHIAGSFDGRPLVFSSLLEVNDYITYRYATFIRNTNSKLLRIEGVPDSELYSKKNYNNINFYSSKIEELSLQKKSNSILQDAVVFIPDSSSKLNCFRYNSISMFLNEVPKRIQKFDSWIEKKSRE